MTQQINLYNPVFLKRNPALDSAALLGYAAAIVLVLCLGSAALVQQQRQQLEIQAAAIDTQIKAEQEKSLSLAAQKAARKKAPELEVELVRLETQVRGRTDGLALVRSGAIGSTTGFSEHMRALARQSVSGLWLTGFSINGSGNEVTLQGRMLDADLLPRFLARIGAEKAFEGRAFKALIIEQSKPADVVSAVLPPAALAAASAGVPSASLSVVAAPVYLAFEITTRESVGSVSSETVRGRK